MTMDLRTLLDDAAGSETAVAPSVVAADLDRGRRALRRHRAKALGVRGGLVAGLALGAVAVASGQGLGRAPHPAPVTATPGTAPPAVTLPPTALVAYTGVQPKGYTLAEIPAGYRIAADQRASLTLERVGAPASDPSSFVDKVAVEQSVDADPRGGHPVTVGGRPATVVDVGGVSSLYLEQGNGSYLLVQVAEGLNWDDAQLVEFASGITVTADATLTYG